jgi:hydroxyethylthiazole kinase
MAVFASAGEKAATKATGPGTFLPHFLDELYAVDAENAAGRVKLVA